MTQGEGQAKVPTTRFLLTPSPYLQRPGSDHAPGKKPSKSWVSPRVKGCRGPGKMEERRGSSFEWRPVPTLSFVSLPSISSLILMSLSGQKQNS